MFGKLYILRGKEAIPTKDVGKWSKHFMKEERIILKTYLGMRNKIEVSTVFLGFDHNFSDEGPPVLFETMVFGWKKDCRQRYSDYDEAIEGHNEIHKMIKKTINRHQRN